MKFWLHQSRGESMSLYIEHNGMMYLVYILNTFGNEQVRIRKLNGEGNWTVKDMNEEGLELTKLIEIVEKEKCLDDPFAFNLHNKRSNLDEYKVGMVHEIQNPKPPKPKVKRRKKDA
jgi:hypothetical protein